jgi:hypothetical protein
VNITKATKRDSKLRKRKSGHLVDGRSVFLLQDIQVKKAKDIEKARKLKEQLLGG